MPKNTITSEDIELKYSGRPNKCSSQKEWSMSVQCIYNLRRNYFRSIQQEFGVGRRRQSKFHD